MLRCKVGNLVQTIWPLVKADIPVIIRGRSGIGKSQMLNEQLMPLMIAEFGETVLHDFRLSSKDITDGTGIPDIDKAERATYWTRPAFIPRDDGRMHVIFLDEVSHASVQMQHAVGYQLTRDRGLGEYKLPKLNRVILAMNISEDKGGDIKLAKPFENRCAHVLVESDHKDWIKWGVERGIDNRLLAFIQLRPPQLHMMSETDPAWPSPRTLEMLSRVMHEDTKIIIRAAQALCGDGFSTEFYKFLKDSGANLPKMADILKNPKGAVVPTELDQQHLVAMAISAHIKAENAETWAIYLRRLPPDMASVAAHYAMQRNPELADNKVLKSLEIGKDG